MDFSAIDLSTAAVFVASIGAIIWGITSGEKGISIGQRNIKKA